MGSDFMEVDIWAYIIDAQLCFIVEAEIIIIMLLVAGLAIHVGQCPVKFREMCFLNLMAKFSGNHAHFALITYGHLCSKCMLVQLKNILDTE
jgi:hypothetical protein